MGRRTVLLGLVLALGVGAMFAGCCREQRLMVDGERRAFRLHVPESLPADSVVPLVLALHQFSDTPCGMERLTGFNALADTEGFIVAYPKGKRRVWNTDNGRDVRFLLGLIDHLAETYPVDGQNVFVTGASAGAVMAQYLATQTDRIRAIAPVMGSLDQAQADSWQPATPLPVLLIHGTDDPVIGYEGGETFAGPGRPRPVFLSAPENAAWWAAQLACEVDGLERSYPGYTELAYTCPEGAGPVLFYTILGGGHTWPGGKNRYPAFLVGNTSEALDASQVIWHFFKQHRFTD